MNQSRSKIPDKKTVESLKEAFLHYRHYSLAKDIYSATDFDNYRSMAMAVRDKLIERWILTQQRYHDSNCKRVYYLSLEFLPGQFLMSHIQSLGIMREAEQACKELGYSLEDIAQTEPDPGLGNGGLGRLAAAFQESMATLGIPATGYGIRYDYGIFRQKIVNGYQRELPDEWLSLGNPWEFERPEFTIKIKFYGRTVKYRDRKGNMRVDWVDTDDILAMAYDVPSPGYRNDVVNNLRLWSARSASDFDLENFNEADYVGACENKILSENVSKVLYPSDEKYKGMELRLKQEYFFTAASVNDMIRRFKMHNEDWEDLPEKVVVQLNDTHPAIAIVELMRLLIDQEGLGWECAWRITKKVFAYTNHTMLPEALEKWPVEMFGRLLPRHLEIIYEINMFFLGEVAKRYPLDREKLARMSLIEESPDRSVRMSNLSIVGSFSVNGVSQLHTELLKKDLFRDFYEFYPEKFNAKTNGITQRRWLLKSNRHLADLISSKIGPHWALELSDIKRIADFAEDKEFCKRWREVKRYNKEKLSSYIRNILKLDINPGAVFDVQVKRIHEYKRQLLFALYLASQYLRIKNGPREDIVPRVAIIGGKAAPSYDMAKLIIKFINNVAQVINNDPDTEDLLRVVFLENYSVSLAERIFPASDLSEQISTAGKEASGTGNMKFMLNGAVTIGTWDGANIEIAEHVGQDNIFIFGKRAEEVEALRGDYRPQDHIKKSPVLSEVLQLIGEDFFSQFEPGIFKPIYEQLLWHDNFFLMADFEDYIQTQRKVSEAYRDEEAWTRMSILNAACSGHFSIDRTASEYAKEIWKVEHRDLAKHVKNGNKK